MRIVHLAPSMENVGNGIVNATVDLACTQAAAGHDVTVASSGGAFVGLLARHGVRHEALSLRRTPGSMIRTSRRFVALVNALRPDVVHAHVMTAALLARGMRPFARARYGLVGTVHNEFRRDAVLMGASDRVIAISDAVFTAMARRGIPRRKLRVVKNGTLGSPRQTAAESAAPKALARPAVTTVAGLFERKGIADLIDAFEALSRRDAHLYVVGDGPERARFEAYARAASSHDRIHFEGFQPSPAAYLASTDVFVLASRAEPWGLAISEAREAGCAIVATAVGGIPEQLEGGRAGTLVPPRAPRALAAAIDALLDDPAALADARLRSARDLEPFRVERVMAQTVDVYSELVGLGGRAGAAP